MYFASFDDLYEYYDEINGKSPVKQITAFTIKIIKHI